MLRKTRHNYGELYRRYWRGEEIRALAREVGAHEQSLYGYFNRHGWPIRPPHGKKRHGSVADDFLDVIDTEEKAYFLGLFCADGWVALNDQTTNSQKRVGMRLHRKDEEHLRQVKDLLSQDAKIAYEGASCRFSVTSDPLADALARLGVDHRKTYTLTRIPEIPDALKRHFVRGHFDGDGSISLRTDRPNQRRVTLNSIHLSFILDLQAALAQADIKAAWYKEDRKGKKQRLPQGGFHISEEDMYSLLLGTHAMRCRFFEYLYSDASIWLPRKYNAYCAYYDNTVLTGRSKTLPAV